MSLTTNPSAENNIVHGQECSQLSGESQTDDGPAKISQDTFHASHGNTLSRLWRPFYLRRSVLFGFMSVFIIIIVAIESMLAISNQHQGLGTADSRQHYLWTYGPTAFLTLIAALWARVEHQSKIVTPWIRLSQGYAPPCRTVFLDYVSPLSIYATWLSLWNRDFIVSITLTILMTLKVLIILSSGLITLSWIGVSQVAYSMNLVDEFVDSPRGILPSQNPDFVFPNGISRNYAFQSVQTELPEIAATQVIVDGLVNSMQCKPANVTLAGAIAPQPGSYRPHNYTSDMTEVPKATAMLDLTISSPRCNVSLASLPGVFERRLGQSNSTVFAKFQQVQCDSILGDEGKRILVMFGNMTYHTECFTKAAGRDSVLSKDATTNPRIGILTQSTTIVCVPEYAIEKIQVTRNFTQTKSIHPVPGTSRTLLGSVTAWDILWRHKGISTAIDDWTTGQSINISNLPVDVDPDMFTALNSQLEPGTQAADLFDASVLQRVVENYYQQLGAILAKLYLMAPTPPHTATLGSITLNENRLILRCWVSQLTVALCVSCVVLIAIAVFLVPGKGFLPCGVATLQDFTSILRYSEELSIQLQHAGASDKEQLLHLLADSRFYCGYFDAQESKHFQFHVIDSGTSAHFPQNSSKSLYPLILHPVCRLTLCLSTIGLIVTLELFLLKSNIEKGLGDVNINTYLQYAWTIVPALILGIISMAFSAVDFQIRTLIPYMTLVKKTPRAVFEQLEFLDMTVPFAVFRQFKVRAFWALCTTTAFLVASFFTNFSASLFQALQMPTATFLTLKYNHNHPFTLNGCVDDTGVGYASSPCLEIPSLILQSNYSFPRFTYKDLVFLEPSATITEIPKFDSTATTISAIVPAIRPKLECISHDPTRVHVYHPIHDRVDEYFLTPRIDGLDPLWLGSPFLDPNATYFGISATNDDSNIFTYLWAHFEREKNTFSVKHAAAISCTMILEALLVNATYIGTEFQLDARNPPQPLEDTVKNITINNITASSFELWGGHGLGIFSVNVIEAVDAFFAVLLTSPWAIPASTLGDPSKHDDVIDAIKLHNGIISAQRLAVMLQPTTERVVNDPNSTMTTFAFPRLSDDEDTQRTVNATVTDAKGRHRVVQDATSTHILVALLATSLILFVTGWVLSPPANVLPRSPTTIASVAALLFGGNIFNELAPDATDPIPGGPDAHFWMGWGNLPDEEGKTYGGENEAGVSRFGIFVIEKEKMHQPE
ncbi:hypothetical protein F4808DRAFT_473139 [Astrocystis sublimbata]|nr:hypothetical protein F4808DRAFT_473139 [Astrocystis sublimbata]